MVVFGKGKKDHLLPKGACFTHIPELACSSWSLSQDIGWCLADKTYFSIN
jgi:hypothetical protein